jgi:RES domain
LVTRLLHPLASGALTPAHAPVGSVWHHIFLDRFPDPLGFGFASSRFSDPRRTPAKRFGVYYVGQTFEVAFLETIVRDLRNGNPGPLVLSASDLDDYVHVHITVEARLDLVDLRGGKAVALGVPTDAVRARSHRFGQRASLAVYQRTDQLDGICYPSRLNGDENLAVYDRAVPKLSAGPRRKLGTRPELAPILTAYRVALV